MKHTRFLVALFLLLSMVALGQTPRPSHVMMSSGDVKWGDAPPVFPKGAKLAVLSGDPSTEGLFVVRLKLPAGYKVAPHWHPTDEQITVLKGTFALGMGDTLNAAAAKSLQVGGYAMLPATMHHYAIAKTATTVQVSGMGPFVLNYVNPADDPSRK